MQIENNPLFRAGKNPLVWGCLLLTAVTILNNWPMAAFGFAWDDHGYIVRNYPIQDPVSLKSILWCLTAFAEANWHPLTWLALHIQFQFFGLNPGGYHVVNLLLHLANTLLLYALLFRTTRAVGKSLAVAALFSVHPLHIESVAWISEIKDVLSTFFFLLTLHAYTSYARRPGPGRYGLVCLSLACGLAAKPMLVTAPFVLVLLDYWPLGRWLAGPTAVLQTPIVPRFPARRLILEKLPLLAMVAAVCVLTFMAQHDGGAVAKLSSLPILMRLGNVANSYLLYLWRMIWPWPLSFFYPLVPVPIWRFALCLLGLAVLSYAMWRTRRNKPYLLFGWLWYLGTLVPVIGLVQVGSQAIADRYTYIPSIGVFIAASWIIDDLRKRVRLSVLLPAAMTIAVVFILMCVSLDYLLKWINEEELYSYGLSLDENNPIARNNLGIFLIKNKNSGDAAKQFKSDLEINTNSEAARLNLANISLMRGNYSEMLDYLLPALQINPNNGLIYYFLGQMFNQVHDTEMAEKLFRKGLNFKDLKFKTAVALTDVLIQEGHYKEALSVSENFMSKIYDKDPQKSMLLWNSSRAHRLKEDFVNAKIDAERALQLQPIFPNARRELALLAVNGKNTYAAVKELKLSLGQYPFDPNTWALLGQIYFDQGRYSRAYEQLRRALCHEHELYDNFAIDAHLNMAVLLRRFGQADDAALHSARANDLRLIATSKAAQSLRQRLFSTVITIPAQK
ncbi:Tetratricopeptide TPR_2 repeat protein [Desulfovibrio sp. DV]|uniref:tetratricopeptide repeat protein n=1 Tax=Desulfovibrio sp. DV TaxID=1844708 RepID=UPI00094B8610|nr:tetratricopeptide repeat protein [Desulfovibrio sp. DV]OLN28461.1 Tetratricopeptide TPR_2 repeat protein [Desulfovibrio sp. DV]